MNPALTEEAGAQLLEGINLVLSRWAALNMAIENKWGGPNTLQKSQKFGPQLYLHLTQSKEKVYIDDIEEMLDELMSSLNTEIEDGSLEEIAEKLMIMHEECLEGKFVSIEKLKETNVPSVSYSRQPGSNDEDDIDDDSGDDDEDDNNMGGEESMEMEVDTPQGQSGHNQNGTMTDEPSAKEVPEVVDGWTVVASRRSRGKRN